jgi:hypothetical protein
MEGKQLYEKQLQMERAKEGKEAVPTAESPGEIEVEGSVEGEEE